MTSRSARDKRHSWAPRGRLRGVTPPDDPCEPGGEGGLAGEVVDGTEPAKIGGLDRVFRLVAVLQYAPCGTEQPAIVALGDQPHRSEERRVGKECVSTCRSRW